MAENPHLVEFAGLRLDAPYTPPKMKTDEEMETAHVNNLKRNWIWMKRRARLNYIEAYPEAVESAGVKLDDPYDPKALRTLEEEEEAEFYR